jgi:hypothetical protein
MQICIEQSRARSRLARPGVLTGVVSFRARSGDRREQNAHGRSPAQSKAHGQETGASKMRAVRRPAQSKAHDKGVVIANEKRDSGNIRDKT